MSTSARSRGVQVAQRASFTVRRSISTTSPSFSDTFLKDIETWQKTIVAAPPKVERDVVSPSRVRQVALTLRRRPSDDPEWYSLPEVQPVNFDLKTLPSIGPAWHFALFHGQLHEPHPGESTKTPLPTPSVGGGGEAEWLDSDGYEPRYSPPDPFRAARMWAGGSISFNPQTRIRAYQHLQQTTSAPNVELKRTKARGDLVMVTERREIADVLTGTRCLTEDRQIVYMREKQVPGPSDQRRFVDPPRPVPDAGWSRAIATTPIQLFRYSSATFNSHLIHYSTPYAIGQEGYQEILVHGPFTCTLLLDLLRRKLDEEGNSRALARFDYRAVAPLFVNDTITVCGTLFNELEGELWAVDQRGSLAMRGNFVLERV